MGLFNRKQKEETKVQWHQDEILSPVEGKLIPMSQVNDPVFSEEVIGKGAAVVPARGRIVAPADGVVNLVFRTKHAIGMVTDGGTELMIHIGLETVGLNGKFFKDYVKEGTHVKAGELLMEFQLDQLLKAGYDMTTMIIVCNSGDYPQIKCRCEDHTKELEPVICLKEAC